MKKNTLNKYLIAIVAFTATLGHSFAQDDAAVVIPGTTTDASSTAVALPGQENKAAQATFTHKYGDLSWETVAELGEDYPAKMFGMDLEAQKKVLWALLTKKGPQEFARYYASYVKAKGHMDFEIKEEKDRDLLFYVIHYMPAELLGKAVQDAISSFKGLNVHDLKTNTGKAINKYGEYYTEKRCTGGTEVRLLPNNKPYRLYALPQNSEVDSANTFSMSDAAHWSDLLTFYITHKTKVKEDKTSGGLWGMGGTTSVTYVDNPEVNTQAELEARSIHLGAALTHVEDLSILLSPSAEKVLFSFTKRDGEREDRIGHKLGIQSIKSINDIRFYKPNDYNKDYYGHHAFCNEDDFEKTFEDITEKMNVKDLSFPKELRKYLVRHLKPEQFNNALTIVNDQNFTLEVGCDVLGQHFDGLEEATKGYAVNVCGDDIIYAALGIELDGDGDDILALAEGSEEGTPHAALPAGEENL